jgi:hypothetical protein
MAPLAEKSSSDRGRLIRLAVGILLLHSPRLFIFAQDVPPQGKSDVTFIPPCVREKAIATVGQPENGAAIWIQPFGRLGNHFFQFARAYCAARVLDFHLIFVKMDFLFINTSINLAGDIRLSPELRENCDRPNCRSHDFFINFNCFEDFDTFFFFSQTRDIFAKTLFRKPDDVTDDVLVLHIRGGDHAVLKADPNIYYGQPPCYYFLSVIRQFNSSLLLTDGASEDGRWNPCHNLTLQAGARATGGDVRTDFERAVWAHNFVLSVSSFTSAALWISPITKRFWTFDNFFQLHGLEFAHPRGNFRYIGDHLNCIASKDYVDTVLQTWVSSDAQFTRMTWDSCTWTQIRRVPPQDWPISRREGVF